MMVRLSAPPPPPFPAGREPPTREPFIPPGASQEWLLVRDEMIRAKAFRKWEQAGCPDGLSDYFWREAEREWSDSLLLPTGRRPQANLTSRYSSWVAAASL